MVTTLTCMRGYSGSGKSTRAREIAKETNAVVVNRDLLRLQLLGEHWTGKREDEDRVTLAEEAQVTAFLNSGTSVVVDAAHLNPHYLRRWARLATRLGVEFEVVDVFTDVAECRRNDHARMLEGGRYVGDKVIEQQAKRYPQNKWPMITAEKVEIQPYVSLPAAPPTIIVDIDGTLAHIPEGGRSPFDYTDVTKDLIDITVRDLVNGWWISSPERRVIVLSGRDNTCFDDTFFWLRNNGVRFDRLIMRDPKETDRRGNKKPDWIIKLGLFNEHIRDRYNVQFVLDDRQQVVDMWRKLGLKCLQVEPGNF